MLNKVGLYVCFIIISLLGVIANSIIQFILYNCPKLTLNLRIVSLNSINDLIISIMSVIFYIYLLIADEPPTGSLTQIIGAFYTIFIFTSVTLVGLFTIERYLKACFKYSLDMLLIKIVVIVMASVISISSVTLAILGEYQFDGQEFYHISEDGSFGSFVKMLSLTVYTVVLCIIIFCYIHISISINKKIRPISFFGIASASSMINNKPIYVKQTKSEVSLSVVYRSIIILLLYTFLLLPQIINFIWTAVPDTDPTDWLQELSSILLILIVLVNPLLTLTLHSNLSGRLVSYFYGSRYSTGICNPRFTTQS
ncbi:hypothetical protein K502DRAFT_243254 [Neoconidiobolus thromboides FSU 785]|nr:hypothetical protein K502DRAFT_243254 [Neoconidiobolus thromboides FSU 785]